MDIYSNSEEGSSISDVWLNLFLSLYLKSVDSFNSRQQWDSNGVT